MSSVQPHFDELIHAPLRLRIAVLLSPVESMSFAALREDLDVAESVLSKHLKLLAEAEYVSLNKLPGSTGRRMTWVRMTKTGRTALRGHLAALAQLADAAQAPSESVNEEVSSVKEPRKSRFTSPSRPGLTRWDEVTP